MTVTKKELFEMVEKLNVMLGRPLTPYVLNDAGQVVGARQGHIMLDYARYYGGYTLTEMQASSGVTNFYRGPRLSAKEMKLFLDGFFMGSLKTYKD